MSTASGITSSSGIPWSRLGGSNARAAATAVASSVTQTDTRTTSDAKGFSEVASDARATLDAGYQTLGRSSDEVYVHGTNADWTTAFGGMDRRSLYAVASNQGGSFTAREQDMAKSLMSKQQGDAMGLNTAAGRLGLNPTATTKAAITFLDSVSAEEKAGSFDWAIQRGVAQSNYEALARRDGQTPENFDSSDPVVRLIKGAQDTLAKLDDPSRNLTDLAQYKQAQQLFAQRNTRGSSSVDMTV